MTDVSPFLLHVNHGPSSSSLATNTAGPSYQDHGKDPIVQQTACSTITTPQRGAAKQFPFKLYEMLKNAEEDIVSWQPHGRAFAVRDPKRFVQEVMPQYFCQSKLASFQRQLSLYGFVRITSGRDSNAYFHELFLRGRPDLAQLLERIKVKGASHKSHKDDSPPDFYKMEPCPPVANLDIPSSTIDSPITYLGESADLEEIEDDYQNEQVHTPLLGKQRSSSIVSAISVPSPKKDNVALVVPGRLRPDTAVTRVVPIPPHVARSRQQTRQSENERWTKALQLNPISKELVFLRDGVPLHHPVHLLFPKKTKTRKKSHSNCPLNWWA